LHALGDGRGGYLAFLGRISPEKGVDRAIEVAKRTGIRLKIAAKVDRVDREYYLSRIAPLLDHPLVEFIGEISEADKQQFLGEAAALVFPIDWPEPFGLVMIEAMSCGLPVIAWRRGSAPEIIDDGITGFLVDDVAGAVRAVERLGELSRRRCREVFEKRFTAARMAADHLRVYRNLASRSAPSQSTASRGAASSRKPQVLFGAAAPALSAKSNHLTDGASGA
jgi:glycosyltransferase involved in cell wall biosynthesis